MSLIFITGTSTSGKSTITRLLLEQGYEAHDTEHNGISAWFNKKTGERAAEFGQVPERTPQWFDQHEWRIDESWVRDIAAHAKEKPIFLCGGAANEQVIRDLSEVVVWLKTDEETIRKRVNRPRDHTYGTKPHELAVAINENTVKEQDYRSHGAVMVDVRQPIDQVIEAILKTADKF